MFISNLAKKLLSGVAAIIMFMMMALTLTDVLGRYLFSTPIKGAFELTEIMLAAVIFLGLPIVTAANDHISVDILDSFLSDQIKKIQSFFISLINIAAFIIFSWVLWKHAFKLLDYGDSSSILKIPYSWLAFLMSIVTTYAALILIVQFFLNLLSKARRGEQ